MATAVPPMLFLQLIKTIEPSFPTKKTRKLDRKPESPTNVWKGREGRKKEKEQHQDPELYFFAKFFDVNLWSKVLILACP